MKKIFLLLFFLVSICTFSQVSVFEAKSTKDRGIVEKFIRDNPKHPAVPELKKRALTLRYLGTDQAAKPTITQMTEKKIEKTSKIGTTEDPNTPEPTKTTITKTETPEKVKGSNTKVEPSQQAKNTAALLTSLFNNNPNKKEAIVQIVNKSACNLVVKISGKKFYNLTVPSNGQNYILVDKGSYNMSTSICDAIYNQNKAITKDIIITLNSTKQSN
ncbi:MAG: hypothetical protein E2590_08285 [Chryseobacterium sp.]|nr:hypothetical protein [Chryseobacterium sp.]